MRLIEAFKAFFAALKKPTVKKKIEDKKKKKAEPEHLRLLSLLQQSGRLVDFLKEDISTFNDAQIGAAVRKLHEGCAKSLEEMVTIRSIFDHEEGRVVEIPESYDSSEIKIVGNVKGNPPYKGVLVHKGWRAHKQSLPKKVGEQNPEVICPAEVEVK